MTMFNACLCVVGWIKVYDQALSNIHDAWVLDFNVLSAEPQATPLMSNPRAATSVAMRTSILETRALIKSTHTHPHTHIIESLNNCMILWPAPNGCQTPLHAEIYMSLSTELNALWHDCILYNQRWSKEVWVGNLQCVTLSELCVNTYLRPGGRYES